MEIPDLIRYMRQQAGVTQTYLAACVHVRTKNIDDYETGERMPTLAKFSEICRALGYKVTVKKIRRGEEDV